MVFVGKLGVSTAGRVAGSITLSLLMLGDAVGRGVAWAVARVAARAVIARGRHRRPAGNAADTSAVVPAKNKSGKPTGKKRRQSASKPVDKPIDKPADQPVGKQIVKSDSRRGRSAHAKGTGALVPIPVVLWPNRSGEAAGMYPNPYPDYRFTFAYPDGGTRVLILTGQADYAEAELMARAQVAVESRFEDEPVLTLVEKRVHGPLMEPGSTVWHPLPVDVTPEALGAVTVATVMAEVGARVDGDGPGSEEDRSYSWYVNTLRDTLERTVGDLAHEALQQAVKAGVPLTEAERDAGVVALDIARSIAADVLARAARRTDRT